MIPLLVVIARGVPTVVIVKNTLKKLSKKEYPSITVNIYDPVRRIVTKTNTPSRILCKVPIIHPFSTPSKPMNLKTF